MSRIGLLDWGIGGLSVYRHLKRALPRLTVLYVSDSGSVPYGKLARARLKERLRDVLLFFHDRGIRRVIVACNAASTVIEELPESPRLGDMSLSGVIDPGVRTALALPGDMRFGVIGGCRTIRSMRYARPLRAAGLVVHQRVAQPLSALIEAGDLGSEHLRGEVRRIISPLARARVDALILACTHYPAIGGLFLEFFPGRVRLIDPGEEAAREAVKELRRTRPSRMPADEDSFFTTGDPRRMAACAAAAFSVRLPHVAHITIKNS